MVVEAAKQVHASMRFHLQTLTFCPSQYNAPMARVATVFCFYWVSTKCALAGNMLKIIELVMARGCLRASYVNFFDNQIAAKWRSHHFCCLRHFLPSLSDRETEEHLATDA